MVGNRRRTMAYKYSRKQLKEFFSEALEILNIHLDTDINEQSVFLDFFTHENGVLVYEKFCRTHFPKMLEERYREPGYFDSTAAQAFLNDTEYGILVREDLSFPPREMVKIFLHELAHLYCSKNEIPGGNFFGKYCMGSGPEDGMMNAGYAIWRETVADIMADSIYCEYPTVELRSVNKIISDFFGELSITNPDSKKAISLIIAYIMTSKEVSVTKDWNIAQREIDKKIDVKSPMLIAILKQVFEQLNQSPFWEITPEFIITLGETYLTLLTGIMLNRIVENK